ncbi:hypothetical protein PHMEG_00034328, partial [Phytophthora megakarya]
MTHILNRYKPGCSCVDRSASLSSEKGSTRATNVREACMFDYSSLFVEHTETFPERSLSSETEDDLYQYVYTRRPGLYKVPESDVESDSNNDLVGAGKPVIGSVNSVEVVSAGYIDCTPADVLIYSGAVASLIDIEVLKRIGRTDTPLRPCDTSLNGVTGHKIGAKGAIDLPLHLGSLEMDRLFVAVNRLHVDVILGRDTLKDFRAVIDLLGIPSRGTVTFVEDQSDGATAARGKANAVTDVIGTVPEGATVLVEGSPELDATVMVARTLCTVQSGKRLVDVCNVSTEDVLLRKGTTVTVTSLVPESAFGFEMETEMPSGIDSQPTHEECPASNWVDSVLSATTNDKGNRSKAMPQLEKVSKVELEVDFNGSKLNKEQQHLLKEVLYLFRDMFVDTSMTPGRPDWLEFSINTGPSLPIKQRPNRVSKAEGDVMEAELQ